MRRGRPLFKAAAVFVLALATAVTLTLLVRDPGPAAEQAARPDALSRIERKNDAAALNAAVRMEAESEASAEAADAALRRNEAAAAPASPTD